MHDSVREDKVSAGRRLYEKLTYYANPWRHHRSYPRSLRDNALWESLFAAGEAPRRFYWELKNRGHRPPLADLDPQAQAMLDDLNTHGIGARPGFLAGEKLAELRRRVREYVLEKKGFDIDEGVREDSALNGFGRDLDPGDPIFRLFRSPELMGVAAGHLRVQPRISRFGIFVNRPVESYRGEMHVAKHWHIDSHDLICLKLFIYLNDVGPENGAFQYIKGTHVGGAKRSKVARVPTYSSTELMKKFFPEDEWTYASGTAGSALFAQTSGLHRGGRVVEGERVAIYAEYAGYHQWRRLDEDIPVN